MCKSAISPNTAFRRQYKPENKDKNKEKMTMRKFQKAVFVLILAVAGLAMAQDNVKVDPAIAKYKKTSGVSGSVGSIGSDTMNNLMTLWGEAFAKFYPNVKLQVEGKGSSTAPPALIAGTAQFGPMSREMKQEEIDKFEAAYGYKPTAIRTSIDALAVYVNKDNPIKGMTMPQVDAVFSKTRRGGFPQDITTWDQLNMTDGWAGKPISLYGRNSASGTYGYFKEHALYKGDYKDTVKEQPGSASVVQGVTEDRFGIGYSGIGYVTSGVRAVPLAAKEGGEYYGATLEHVVSGKYPLARFLYLYINKAPNKPLDPLVREFCKFVLSQEGQQVVIKDGYLPIPSKVAMEELKKLE
jgi:phosphate transport system substrate-binding protein